MQPGPVPGCSWHGVHQCVGYVLWAAVATAADPADPSSATILGCAWAVLALGAW
jgi:hypothetical protein